MKVLNGERPNRPSGPPVMFDMLWQHVTEFLAESPSTRPSTRLVVQHVAWPIPGPRSSVYSAPLAPVGNPSGSTPGPATDDSFSSSFVHDPGQQVQLAPLSGPGSTSHSGLIDPCNLFCNNLDPDIDSKGLFSHFRQFGQIVSARVMRNENGESRGFGFVSYQTPDQVSAALHAMNGVLLGTKQVVVQLHVPKQLDYPRNSSGATSPTASEGGENIAGWSHASTPGSPVQTLADSEESPRHRTSALGSPVQTDYDRPDRGRRGSESYYNAVLSGTLNLPMRYDELYALSPVVRQEVLTGELSRRIKSMSIVPNAEVDSIVESLVQISLQDVIYCIEDPAKLTEQVNTIRHSLRPSKQSSPSKSPSPSASQDSRLLDPNALNATASAPEQPSTPISINASLSTSPRTSSPSGSVPPTSERERIRAAISKLESTRQGELTELLMSLPKRERAMCLFNVEILRTKVADAKVVLDSGDDDDESLAQAAAAEAIQPVPITPQAKKIAVPTASPQTPDLSSRGPSATALPSPATPGSSAASGHTIASPAQAAAVEAIQPVPITPQAKKIAVRTTSPQSVRLPAATDAPARPAFKEPPPEADDDLLARPAFQEPPPEVPDSRTPEPAVPSAVVIPPTPQKNDRRVGSPKPSSRPALAANGSSLSRSSSGQAVRGPRGPGARGPRPPSSVSSMVSNLNRKNSNGLPLSVSPSYRRISGRSSSILGRAATFSTRTMASDDEDQIVDKK
ncbi:hypothetical protein K438DRAFT_296690 [Mycena galopus ATCC 62051]|nr:hypothetical protein K438DRAFT_296690 [Mycena galopus ATCC 62051]